MFKALYRGLDRVLPDEQLFGLLGRVSPLDASGSRPPQRGRVDQAATARKAMLRRQKLYPDKLAKVGALRSLPELEAGAAAAGHQPPPGRASPVFYDPQPAKGALLDRKHAMQAAQRKRELFLAKQGQGLKAQVSANSAGYGEDPAGPYAIAPGKALRRAGAASLRPSDPRQVTSYLASAKSAGADIGPYLPLVARAKAEGAAGVARAMQGNPHLQISGLLADKPMGKSAPPLTAPPKPTWGKPHSGAPQPEDPQIFHRTQNQGRGGAETPRSRTPARPIQPPPRLPLPLGREPEAPPFRPEPQRPAPAPSRPASEMTARTVNQYGLSAFWSGLPEAKKYPMISASGWGRYEPGVLDEPQGPYWRITLHDTGTRRTPEAVEELHGHEPWYSRLGREFKSSGKAPSYDAYQDVGYNFLITEDGTIYEGRTLSKLGAHVGSENHGNIGIAFVGNYADRGFTEPQAGAGKALIARLIALYGLDPAEIYTHGYYNEDKRDELAGPIRRGQLDQMTPRGARSVGPAALQPKPPASRTSAPKNRGNK